MALLPNLLMENNQPVPTKYNTLVQATTGFLSLSVAGSADVTLTNNQASHWGIKLTGVLTGDIDLIVPTREKPYFFYNATTGLFTVTVKTAAGTGIVIPQNAPRTLVYCDGTNVEPALGSTTGMLGGLTANKILYATGDATALTDTHLHWDTDNNWIGVGVSSPETSLHVRGNDGTQGGGLFDSYIASTGGPSWAGRHARGTAASPTLLDAGDGVATFGGFAWARDAANTVNQWERLGRLRFTVDSKDAQGRMGGRVEIRLSPGVSAADVVVWQLTEAGNMLLGTTTFGTSTAKALVFENGTKPTTFPANVTHILSADRDGVAGKAGLHIYGETGTGHVLADHACFGVLANGQQLVFNEPLTELLTIAAAATSTTAIQIPANAVVFGVSVLVTTVIPTATTFDVGVSGATTRYGTGLSTAATTAHPGTNDATRFYAAATSLVITPNLTPGANTGRVRVTIHYYTIVPATS